MINPTCVIDSTGNKLWYLHGQLHREDGPAVEYFNGINQWFLNGKQINCLKDFCKILKMSDFATNLFLKRWNFDEKIN
jgi:hypothetical protein